MFGGFGLTDRAALAAIAIVVGATGALAQEGASYCGEGGPIIVSVEPITKDLDVQALSFAKEDAGAAEIVAARDFNATAMSGSEMVAVITAFGMPGLFSSGAMAAEHLGGLDCDRAIITPLP